MELIIYKMADGGHLGFSLQKGTKTHKLPSQSVRHANVSGNRHLDCPFSSSRARDMKFHIFQNGGGGHF